MRVELTNSGSVRMDAQTAAAVGAADGVLVRHTAGEVRLTFLPQGTIGGLILKRTDPHGSRAVLVVEHIRNQGWDPGVREAEWVDADRELIIPLRVPAISMEEEP